MAIQKHCWRCGKAVPMNHKHRDKAKERQRRQDPNQRALRGIGAIGRAWRRERARYLRLHPVCQHEDGCIEPASHVHHLDGLGPTGPKGLDHSNFRGLCPSHHGQVEDAQRRRDDKGQWL
jgi:5-methylcytosine-specific restriction protein A